VRVGILGGTFDPPHVGHLLMALDAIDALALDRVVLVPAATQPLKAHDVYAAPEQRLAMTRLLVADEPDLQVDALEIERGGLSFTIDTLTQFAARAPGDERYLLVGADVARTFSRWREPEAIRRLATVAVWRRGDDPDGDASLPPAGGAPAWVSVPSRRIDVSSSEIRERVHAGQSIRGFVPDAVREYIEATGLYGTARTESGSASGGGKGMSKGMGTGRGRGRGSGV
jgi:nicotinate-nucleotide adenylyltransferase